MFLLAWKEVAWPGRERGIQLALAAMAVFSFTRLLAGSYRKANLLISIALIWALIQRVFG